LLQIRQAKTRDGKTVGYSFQGLTVAASSDGRQLVTGRDMGVGPGSMHVLLTDRHAVVNCFDRIRLVNLTGPEASPAKTKTPPKNKRKANPKDTAPPRFPDELVMDGLPLEEKYGIGIWNADTKRKMRVLTPNVEGDPIGEPALSPDGSLVACMVQDPDRVVVLRMEDGRLFGRIPLPHAFATFRFLTNDRLMVKESGAENKLYDVESRTVVANFRDYAWASDAKVLFGVRHAPISVPNGSYEFQIFAVDPVDGAVRSSWICECSLLTASPDGRLVATIDRSDPHWHLWHAPTGQLLYSMPLDRREPREIAFSPNGKTLAILYGDALALHSAEATSR
jgi:hypothetical protein